MRMERRIYDFGQSAAAAGGSGIDGKTSVQESG